MKSGEILFVTEGKDSSTIKMFAEELPKYEAKVEQIEEITMDMSSAFIRGTSDHISGASVTFDKFHVIKALNKAQDEVRWMEQKKNPLLKRSRYIWLKNPENLTSE